MSWSRLGFQRNEGSKTFGSYLRSIYRKPGFAIGVIVVVLFAVVADLHTKVLDSVLIEVAAGLGLVILGYPAWRRWGRNY